MYKSYKNYIITKPSDKETKSIAGIYIASAQKVPSFTVVDGEDELVGKDVYTAHESHAVALPDGIHYSIHKDNIIAYDK